MQFLSGQLTWSTSWCFLNLYIYIYTSILTRCKVAQMCSQIWFRCMILKIRFGSLLDIFVLIRNGRHKSSNIQYVWYQWLSCSDSKNTRLLTLANCDQEQIIDGIVYAFQETHRQRAISFLCAWKLHVKQHLGVWGPNCEGPFLLRSNFVKLCATQVGQL